MARPRNQEARKRELVSVTSRLLIERGQAGARLVDIAEAASLTPAAVSYYYPDLADLYADTYETATEQYLTRRRQLVSEIAPAVERLIECIALGVPHAGTSSRAATVLLMELSALAIRQERIVASGLEFETEQLRLFGEILDQGVAEGTMRLPYGALETARAILAVEDGIAIPVVAGRLPSDEALRVTLSVATSLTGADLLAARG
ncbi:TetR/AcrR family transcriptional regulator [Leucobacter sp. NPDC077196]|uniref:TetR/AcrR family transcriptional regulator n=1 Tax=Leucobacter sp. NPDC077196 TaxID=3154959 RepID=UPI0034257B30